MTTTVLAPQPEITEKQEKYVADLAAQRPTWVTLVTGENFETITDVLANLQVKADAAKIGTAPAGLKKIIRKHASSAIDALLGVKPSPLPPTTSVSSDPKPTTAQPTPFQRLQVLLHVIPVSKSVRFALEIDGTWQFFSVDTRKKDGVETRWVNKLLGAPGNWNRKFLPVEEQLKIARLIATNWEQAAADYATKHGRCARCDAHLSDERSRAAKVGWKCAKEWGWAW